jgi:aminopeptidase N
LVTAERWGFEFLHESFAAFFQNRATQQFRPDQEDYIESTMVWNKNAGLYSQKTTEHAVVADRAYFDDVTYDAGGKFNIILLTNIFCRRHSPDVRASSGFRRLL